ncbi:MAG: hypothetical protein NC127_06810 [Muribaculum sp.]|nr:hypothetical protein [Muribaculum sp.]
MKTISIHPQLPRGNDVVSTAVNLRVNPLEGSSVKPPLTPAVAESPDCPSDSGRADVAPRRYPPISFKAMSRQVYTDCTREFTLSGDADYLHWSGPVAESDAAAVRADLQSLYLDISDRARRAGLYTQPMMVWYKVIDSDRNELYRSAPVVVGVGEQALGKLSVTPDGGSSASPSFSGFKMSIEAFRLGVVFPEEISGDYEDAAALEIMVTPQLPVVSLGFDASVAMARDDAGGRVLEARLSKSPYADSLIPAMLDRLDRVSEETYRFGRAFFTEIDSLAGTEIAVTPLREMSVSNESSSLMKKLKTALPAVDKVVTETSVPHGFSANVATRIADMMVYADVTPVHCKPPRLSEISEPSDSPSAWTGVVRVTIAGDSGKEEVLSTTESGMSGMPLGLSPLMAYPLPNAVRMQVQVTAADTGERRLLDFPLRPTPAGTMAYWADRELAPVKIASGDLSATPLAPVNRQEEFRHPGLIAVASVDNPRQITACINVCDGSIVSVTPSVRSSGAWDFGRRHLYAFSTDGVYSVAVNTSCTLLSAHLIDALPVEEGCHTAYSPYGVYFLSGDSLWKALGSRAVHTLSGVEADAVVWNKESRELWCLRDGDNGHIVLDNGGCWYLSKASSGVEWSTRISIGGMTPMPLRRLCWLVAGSGLSVDLEISGDNGNPDEAVAVSNLRVSGDLSAPVRTAVISRPYRYLTAKIKGTVNDDFKLSGLMLGFVD